MVAQLGLVVAPEGTWVMAERFLEHPPPPSFPLHLPLPHLPWAVLLASCCI